MITARKVVLEMRNRSVHIAIVDMPTIRKIVSGEKTIESRFSKNRISPHGRVKEGDLVLLKSSGSGVFGYFFVDHTKTLIDFDIGTVKEMYNDKIIANDDFWRAKTNARYASLIYCKNAAMAESGVYFKRKGMNGWIHLSRSLEQRVICFSGKICSGKSMYSKRLAEILDAQYIHFGSIIKKYAKRNGVECDRESLQRVGECMVDTLGSDGLMELVMSELDGSTRDIIFDGIRHEEVYAEIKRRFENAKLVYVEANAHSRHQRYIKREGINLSYEEFADIDGMPVEQGIISLKEQADYIIKSVPETSLDTAIDVTSNIIASMITGEVCNMEKKSARGKMVQDK